MISFIFICLLTSLGQTGETIAHEICNWFENRIEIFGFGPYNWCNNIRMNVVWSNRR